MPLNNLYSDVCRTCLTKSYHMRSIFNTEELIEPPVTLYEMLITCASIQVAKGDGLPEQVCLNCIQEINRAYLFHKLCEKSDTTLRHHSNQVTLPSTKIDETPISGSQQEYVPLKEIYTEKLLPKDQININKLNDFCFESDNLLMVSSITKNAENDAIIKENSNRIKEKQKPYYCKFYKQAFAELTTYSRHRIVFHNKVFTCKFCKKQFKSETAFTQHHKLLHKFDDKTESLQRKAISNRSGVTRGPNLSRTCTICNKTFRYHSNLERHKLIHTGEKPHLCNVCGKGFAQLSYLKIHYFTHTGEKPYKCQMCGKSFGAPGTLVTHIRTHTGERPHVCKICGKYFSQSGYLASHIRIHTGEKPIECMICHRRFSQRGRLNAHMRIHSGEKPYSCKDCGKSFAINNTLKKHIRTHTGEKPYVCTVCGQAFAQNGTLATHMKVHKSK